MSSNKVVIYGNGNMARMLHQFIKLKYDVVGFTVDKACMESDRLNDLPLVSFDQVENVFSPQEHSMIIAVGFVRMNDIRAQRYHDAKEKGYSFINYIHDSTLIHKSISMGENNIILDLSSIHPYASLGNSNFIASNVNIGHGCEIKDNCWVNSGVSIGGETVIGNNCFLGMNVAISNDIDVGNRNFIGATVFISRSTEVGEVYLSEPAQTFRLDSDAFLRFSSAIK